MVLKQGYTKDDVKSESKEHIRSVKINGQKYSQLVVLLYDRVGRTIGHRAITPLV